MYAGRICVLKKELFIAIRDMLYLEFEITLYVIWQLVSQITFSENNQWCRW